MRSAPIAHLLPELQKAVSYNPLTGRMWRPKTPEREIGCIHNRLGYRVFNYKGRVLRAHRVAWLLHHKTEPPQKVDHIDSDRTNNAVWNLRDGTEGVNEINRPKTRVDNVSGVTGVSWHSTQDKWRANFRRSQVYIGDDFLEAVSARKSAENRYWANHG